MAGNIFQIKFACSSRRETLVKKLKSPELSVRRSVCYTYNCIPNWNCLSVIECAVVFNELSVRHLFPPKHATLRNSKLIDRLHSISMLFGRIDRMSHASIYHHPVVTSSSSSSSVTPLPNLPCPPTASQNINDACAVGAHAMICGVVDWVWLLLA